MNHDHSPPTESGRQGSVIVCRSEKAIEVVVDYASSLLVRVLADEDARPEPIDQRHQSHGLGVRIAIRCYLVRSDCAFEHPDELALEPVHATDERLLRDLRTRRIVPHGVV